MNRRYRRAIIAGNWKMNKNLTETQSFASSVKVLLSKKKTCDIVLCVPFTNIRGAIRAFKDCRVAIGAQNVSSEASGAYTGEISADMLKDLGTRYVIVGHSECRARYQESDATINKKVKAAIAADIHPIICVGESLEQRELGVTLELIDYQIRSALSGISADDMHQVVVAYEPIWAIGTGKTANGAEAESVCASIRATIRHIYGARVARGISILYGGSMNEKNATEFLSQPDIDGGLIGGASLDPERFLKIVDSVQEEA